MRLNIYIAFFCILFCLAGCKKLEQKDFYLDNNCEDCRAHLQKDVVKVEGIYYADYEAESGKLNVKFDPVEFQVTQLYEYLQQNGFTKSNDSTLNLYPKMPICCKK